MLPGRSDSLTTPKASASACGGAKSCKACWAARELTEALIINPYHVEETADALHRAATMPAAEQRERMASLRATVREFNVFRWAGRMLADAGRWRLRARVEARVKRLQLP